MGAWDPYYDVPEPVDEIAVEVAMDRCGTCGKSLEGREMCVACGDGDDE